MSDSLKCALCGVAFGLCFPLGSVIFLWASGALSMPHGLLAAIVQSHSQERLLYVIDTAPLFLGLFAGYAGKQKSAVRRFTAGLEQEVAQKTESLRRALADAQKANEKVIHLAEHDALTGLLNRRRFQAEIDRWAGHVARYKREVTLMFVDLDKFKHINDTFGHAAGDSFLIAAAEVLQRGRRSVDYIARWGGDEFAVLLPEASADVAAEVANKLLGIFSNTKVSVCGQEMPISASIGIAVMPQHTRHADELLMFADAAMYEAKQSGRGCWRMYSASGYEVEHIQEKVHWEDRIRRALEADQFVLLYQPLLNLGNGKTHHYEALLRMEDRNGKLITPGMFLESAELFDLSIPIDRMVVRKIANKLSALSEHEPEISLSMNLARKSLTDPVFLDNLGKIAQETGIKPERLGFEIQERMALENLGCTQSLAAELKRAGHPLILDDFGGGFASQRCLEQLSPTSVKVQGSLLRNLLNDPHARRRLRDLTAMVHKLGIDITAKFVEDRGIMNILADLGVDYAQGFAVGKPIEVIEQAALRQLRIA